MQNVSKKICQAFRDARRALHLSQSVLANEIGCHQEAISMFECGKSTKISEENVSKLAKRLGIDLKKLQNEEDNAGKPAAAFRPLLQPVGLLRRFLGEGRDALGTEKGF